jgi:hypothetical protein
VTDYVRAWLFPSPKKKDGKRKKAGAATDVAAANKSRQN